MSDDLADLLRTAMKTLDDQVPPGYFDDFPRQTLARLEDGSMDNEPSDAPRTSSPSEAAPAATPAPAIVATDAAPAEAPADSAAKRREEDSGLHDIRSLASSQRMRIRRASQGPSNADDDLLASASGSWRALALPEPAKMVALPDLADLSPAQGGEPKSSDGSPAAPAEGATKGGAKGATKTAAKTAAKETREAAVAVEPTAATPIEAAKGKPRPQPATAGKRGGRSALIAAAGLGLAAAAGAVIVFSTRGKSEDAAMQAEPVRSRESVAMPELHSVAPRAPAAAEPEPATAGSAAAVAAEPKPDPAADKGKASPAPEKPGKSVGKYVPNVVDDQKAPEKHPEEPKKKPEPGEPDFDKLLKEAGYQEKQAEAPKLEKKSLSGDDIKKGMNAVASRVSSCYAGQQGTASVKLIVAPTGQVQKVTVSGVFAGTPVGACVEGALQGVTFPPWDGGPQSINYSYLLAE